MAASPTKRPSAACSASRPDPPPSVNIEWSDRAVRELAQLRDYIAKDSPFYARQFTERLVLAVERLATLPHSGRTVGGTSGNHRKNLEERERTQPGAHRISSSLRNLPPCPLTIK